MARCADVAGYYIIDEERLEALPGTCSGRFA